MNNQIHPVFYDPQKKRWKRLRRVFDVLALLGVIVFIVFIIGLLRIKPMKELLLPTPTHNYRALNNPPVQKTAQKLRRAPHRKTDRAPSDIPLNSGEGRVGSLQLLLAEAAHQADRPALSRVAAHRDARGEHHRLHGRQPALSSRR
jgi:hypothetical protein